MPSSMGFPSSADEAFGGQIVPQAAGDVDLHQLGVAAQLLRAAPAHDDRAHGRIPQRELHRRGRQWHVVCTADRDDALPAAAVQFALRDPAVRSVVVGGSLPEQLRRNAELMAVDIPAGLWDDLAAEGLIR